MLYFFLFFSFLFGAVIGSFINCFVWRLRKNETLWGRSYCPNCRRPIAWFDNVPVLSFFLLGGRCRKCGKKISWQYPLAEISTAGLFALSFFLVSRDFAPGGFSPYDAYFLSDGRFILALVKDWLMIFAATVIFIYDARWYLIPDRVAVPASLLVLAINIFLGFDWPVLLFCALAGGGFFLLQFLVSRGRWVGGGDIRLGVLIGLATGSFELLALSLLLTYFIGSAVGILWVLIGKKNWDSRIPLGVFLAPSLLVSLFWGKSVLAWYFSLY